MVGFKRVYNITKTLKDVLPPDPSLFDAAGGAGALRPVRGKERRIPDAICRSGATRRRSAFWSDSRRP